MSPRTKEQCEEIREKRIQQIMHATEQLYLERGTNFDIRDVAKKANLGYGTVYHYYSNKRELLHDLFEKGFRSALVVTQQVFTAEESPISQLEAYCNQLPARWIKDPSSFIVYKAAAENFCGLEEGVGFEWNLTFQLELYKPLVDCLNQAKVRGQMNQRQSAEQVANLLIGSLVGCYGIHLYHGNVAFDTTLLSRMLVNGIQSDKGGALL